MGEGLAIGFDAIDSGTVIGTPMAGLAGATYSVTLPRTGIGMNVPAERLFHLDGTPREAFRPKIGVDVELSDDDADPFVRAALRSFEAPAGAEPDPPAEAPGYGSWNVLVRNTAICPRVL